ncbi:IS200/IS605 family transposase [Rothia sp. P3C3.S176]|uniref:IS200/IS605 family transposase n=1 Tax=Rothia sp. P3C3.S176 TaxID=2962204 RepID=UPI0020C8A425|nr:IS200/IS605 family transposase [Rothia sp. P3C3.S176]
MNKDDYRRGRHVVYDLHAHIVLTPKYRRKVMTERVHALIEETTREVCQRFDVVVDEFNTNQDHAHLLITYPPKVSLSTLIGAIKTNTAKRVRAAGFEEVQRALWGEHFWSPSYFVASTGGAPLEKVRVYVQQQGQVPRGPGNPLW